MTEETAKTEVVEEKVLSPIEETAVEQGWVPKEEWVQAGKDADDWRPAKEFVDRGELYKTIHTAKRELKQTQQALTALTQHNRMIFEKAHQKALADLKRERRMAVKEGDVDRVEEVEEQIEETVREHQEQVQAQTTAAVTATAQPPAEYQIWVERNTWYNQDQDMREFADATGLIHMQKNPGIAPGEVLKYVESKVKKTFADKFGTQRKAAPNAVTTVDKTAGNKPRTTKETFELSSDERNVMNTLVRQGVLTEGEYIEQLKKVR